MRQGALLDPAFIAQSDKLRLQEEAKKARKAARAKKKAKRIKREKEEWEDSKKARERKAKEKSVPQGGQPGYHLRSHPR